MATAFYRLIQFLNNPGSSQNVLSLPCSSKKPNLFLRRKERTLSTWQSQRKPWCQQIQVPRWSWKPANMDYHEEGRAQMVIEHLLLARIVLELFMSSLTLQLHQKSLWFPLLLVGKLRLSEANNTLTSLEPSIMDAHLNLSHASDSSAQVPRNTAKGHCFVN